MVSSNTKKNKLSSDVTEHIARLAHIELNDDEKETFTTQLNSILENFEILKEVNVDNIKPTRHAMDIEDVFREDKPKKSLSQKKILENVPDKEDGYIKAPRIV